MRHNNNFPVLTVVLLDGVGEVFAVMVAVTAAASLRAALAAAPAAAACFSFETGLE